MWLCGAVLPRSRFRGGSAPATPLPPRALPVAHLNHARRPRQCSSSSSEDAAEEDTPVATASVRPESSALDPCLARVHSLADRIPSQEEKDLAFREKFQSFSLFRQLQVLEDKIANLHKTCDQLVEQYEKIRAVYHISRGCLAFCSCLKYVSTCLV